MTQQLHLKRLEEDRIARHGHDDTSAAAADDDDDISGPAKSEPLRAPRTQQRAPSLTSRELFTASVQLAGSQLTFYRDVRAVCILYDATSRSRRRLPRRA